MTAARMWCRRLAVLTAAAFLLVYAAAHADDTAPSTAEPPAGQLLIAAAGMQDPRFSHSVILLLRHDAKGAFGIAINRPIAEKRIAELLADGADKDAKKEDDAAIDGTIRVFFGGPVQPNLGFVIHSPEYHRPETLAVEDIAAMTATRDVLRDIGHHRGPQKYLFALGYAGWGAGQLEGEIARRDWFTTPADAEMIFGPERATLWERALARRTRDL